MVPASRMPSEAEQQASPHSLRDDFGLACSQTREALRCLAAKWRDAAYPSDGCGHDAGLAAAAWKLADDAEAFSEESFAWSNASGLSLVVPAAAASMCKVVACNQGRDGLQPSAAGGSVRYDASAKLFVAPAPPCGFGLFAADKLKKGTVVGEYTGEVRSFDIWAQEILDRKRADRGAECGNVPFIREELYCAWAGPGPRGVGVVIDAFFYGNAMRFINCSCNPNCTFKSFGNGAEQHYRLRVEMLRDVEAWEQLSVDYGWYFDLATRSDIQDQALKAYCADVPTLGPRLVASLPAAPSCLVGAFGVSAGAAPGTRGAEGEEGEAPDRIGGGGESIYVAASAVEIGTAAGGVQPTEGFATMPTSEAVHVLAEAVREARCGPSAGTSPPSFLRRFALDGESLALLAERAAAVDGYALPEVRDVRDIPDAVWPLYEVLGAERVGIACRCALDPSLNPSGRCSGIIGRPFQSKCDGRNDLDTLS